MMEKWMSTLHGQWKMNLHCLLFHYPWSICLIQLIRWIHQISKPKSKKHYCLSWNLVCQVISAKNCLASFVTARGIWLGGYTHKIIDIQRAQPLKVSASRMLPGFGRKCRIIEKLDCVWNLSLSERLVPH